MALRFNNLPQPVRERFVQITTAPERHPLVLAMRKSWAGGTTLASVLGVLSVLAIGFILHYTVGRGQRFDPRFDREAYLGLAAAIAVLVLCVSTILIRRLWKPPPYQPGIYAFPSYLVEATDGELTVRPLTEIGVPNVVTVRRNGRYTHTRLELGGPFTFYYTSDEAAQAGWSRLAEARGRFRAMMAARDTNAITAIDPFWECTVHGAWQVPEPAAHLPAHARAQAGPLATKVPTAIRVARWGVALVLGLMVTGVYYAAIDAIFEEERAEYDKRFQTPTPAPPARRRR